MDYRLFPLQMKPLFYKALIQTVYHYGVRFGEKFQPCFIAVKGILPRHVLNFIREATVLHFELYCGGESIHCTFDTELVNDILHKPRKVSVFVLRMDMFIYVVAAILRRRYACFQLR